MPNGGIERTRRQGKQQKGCIPKVSRLAVGSAENPISLSRGTITFVPFIVPRKHNGPKVAMPVDYDSA
jgi:hypothetical protein